MLSSCFSWCRLQDLNLRPPDYKSATSFNIFNGRSDFSCIVPVLSHQQLDHGVRMSSGHCELSDRHRQAHSADLPPSTETI